LQKLGLTPSCNKVPELL